jgi:hypothetical protein
VLVLLAYASTLPIIKFTKMAFDDDDASYDDDDDDDDDERRCLYCCKGRSLGGLTRTLQCTAEEPAR